MQAPGLFLSTALLSRSDKLRASTDELTPLTERVGAHPIEGHFKVKSDRSELEARLDAVERSVRAMPEWAQKLARKRILKANPVDPELSFEVEARSVARSNGRSLPHSPL